MGPKFREAAITGSDFMSLAFGDKSFFIWAY